MTVRLDFVAVGPQRTGTTWLYDYLLSHPVVSVSPQVKESGYFDVNYERGPEWYAGLFEGSATGTKLGEVGSTYFHHARAPERVALHNPAMQAIATLREPVSRLVSLHAFMQRLGKIPRSVSLSEALDTSPHLLETSRYRTHVLRWQQALGAGQVRVLLYEGLASDRAAFAREVCVAIGAPHHDVAPRLQTVVNPAAAPRSYTLTRWADGTTSALRRAGLHRMVNLAKRMGLRKLVERPARDRREASPLEAAKIFELLGDEFVAIPGVAESALAPWHDAWARYGIPV